MTGNHLIAVNNGKLSFVPANRLKSNDFVYVNFQQQLQSVRVKNVSEEYKIGYFTPMTNKGKTTCTLLRLNI